MFDNSITLNIGGGVTVQRINQDKYSSEYLSRSTDHEIRLNIRHTNYTAKDRGGVIVDRHNVELMYTQFPDDTIPFRKDVKMYFVLEVERKTPPVDPGEFAQALIAAFAGDDVSIATDSIEGGNGIGKLLQLES